MNIRQGLKNYGYKPPVIEEKNYVLGGILSAPYEVLQEDGNWKPYLPETEEQRSESYETNACTIYGTLNAIETLMFRKFGVKKNYCERFTAIMSGLQPDGNDPHKVAESIRKNGVIEDFNLPFSTNIRSFEEYMTPNPMSKYYLDLGKKWLEEYEFKHEYVFNSFDSLKAKQEKMIKALKSSPLGVSVSAWQKNDEGLYYKFGMDNHWTLLIVNYVEGKYWEVFDSYDGFIKKLVWDYDFGICKRYHIEKRPTQEEKNMYYSMLELMKQLLNIMSELYKITLGKIWLTK